MSPRPGSLAASFFNNILTKEEIRQGQALAECWLTDADKRSYF